MKQRIIIEIDNDDPHQDEPTPPYELIEKKAGGKEYPALRCFFEDIGYTVTKLELSEIPADEGDKLVEETFKNQERPSVVLDRSAVLGNVLQASAGMRKRCEEALKEYGLDADPEAVESMKELIKHFNKLEATIRRKM